MDTSIFERLKQIHIADPTRPINPNIPLGAIYYCERTAESIQKITSSLQEDERLSLAVSVATKYKVRELVRYMPYYQISDQNNQLRLCLESARVNGRVVTREVQKFGEFSPDELFIIAKSCIIQNPKGFIEYIESFQILPIDKLDELASLCLLHEPSTFILLSRFFSNLPDFNEPLNTDSVKRYIATNFSEELADKLYSLTSRRDVGIRLFGIWIKSRTEGKDIKLSELIFESTGLNTNVLNNQNVKHAGDILSVVLEIYSKLGTKIPFLDKMNLNSIELSQVLLFLQRLNSLVQVLSGIGKIDEISTYSGLDGMIEGDNINESILKGLILQIERNLILLLSRYIEKDSYCRSDSEILNRLLAVPNLVVLISRLIGKGGQETTIRFLLRGVLVPNNEFISLKYHGIPNDPKDQKLASLQLSMLSEAGTKIWKENSLYVTKVVTSNFGAGMVLDDMSIFDGNFPQGRNIGVIPEGAIDLGDMTSKELLSTVKSKFGKDKQGALEYLVECIRYVFGIDKDKYLRILGNLKGIQDYLGLTLEQKKALTGLTKRGFAKDTYSYCITVFTDERDIVVNLGDLVDAISCHNPSYGSYIEVIPSYLLDANVKMLLGYIIPGRELLSNGSLANCLDKLSQVGAPVQLVSMENGNLLIRINSSNKDKVEELTLNNRRPHLRQVIKVGSLYQIDDSAGIIMEPPLVQTHHLLPDLKNLGTNHIAQLSNSIGCLSMKSINMPKTRNPGGSYSDIMDGIQLSSYTIKFNHEN